MLDPLRIELFDNQRSARATIYNQSPTEPTGYTISTQPRRMKEDGTLYKPTQLSKREVLAKSMFRFSPRSSEITPFGKQVIRIAVRKPPNLPYGEYFTYMSVQPVDATEKKRKKTTESMDEQPETAEIALKMRVGVSIPLIIRHGKILVKTTVQDVKKATTPNGKPAYLVKLNREGNCSSYVGVSIYGMLNGKDTLIAEVPRVVTYIPLSTRLVTLPLMVPEFEGRKIRVDITDFEDRDKKLLDSKEFQI